jgi:TrmH family RNA methyltransferase
MIQPLSIARTTLVRSLHRKKGRLKEGAYLAEGERLLREIPADYRGVRFLFGLSENVEWLADQFPGLPVFVAGRDGGLFATEHSQGVAAVVDIPLPPSLAELAGSGRPLLMLDRVADPGNVGTIIRSADWFGLGGVLLGAESVDLYNPKTVRATMGAIFRLPAIEGVSVDDLVALGRPLIGLDAGSELYLESTELPSNGIYVIGGEAHGPSPELREASRQVSIRGSGQGESLNAAIAGSILCYELARRLPRKGP